MGVRDRYYRAPGGRKTFCLVNGKIRFQGVLSLSHREEGSTINLHLSRVPGEVVAEDLAALLLELFAVKMETGLEQDLGPVRLYVERLERLP